MAGLAEGRVLRVEILVRSPADPERLNGCGLIVVNPPYTLQTDLAAVLPEIARRVSDGGIARFHLGPIDAADIMPGRRSATPRRESA